MKKALSFFLTLVLTLGIFCSMPFTESPFKIIAEAGVNGKCGDNVKWSLNDNGKMTISGKGEMADYEFDTDVPWHSKRAKIKKVVIKSGVTKISANAFVNCKNLTSLTTPDTITSFHWTSFDSPNINYLFVGNDYVFSNLNMYGYTKLKTLVLGDGVTTVPEHMFNGNSSLVSVTIGNGVKDIGGYAFCNCINLTTVKIGKNVKKIGDAAFYECKKIKKVYIEDLAAWCGIEFEDPSEYNSSNPLVFAKKLYIKGKLVTDIVIPNSVKKIKDAAFINYDGIKSVTIPDSVTSIGECVFFGCKNLKKAKIGNGLKRIKYAVFSHCGNLTSVAIGKKVTVIEDYAFNKCNKLKYVFYAGNKSNWNKIAFSCFNLDLTSATIHYNATDHTGGSWIVGKKATVNAPGSKHKKCKVCKANFKVTAIPQLKCAKPVLKKVTSTSKGVKFTWGEVAGADSYVVYRKTGSGNWMKVAQNVKTTYYTDKTTEKGQTYKYTVRAKNEAGLSSYNSKGLTIKY